jgi:glutathione S-transferase
MLELFHHPGFVSLAALIALEEAGASYRCTLVDFAHGENRRPAFLAINPYGQVPALKLPSGVVITETVAIMCYIANEYGAATLAPTNPIEYARWIAAMARMATEYHPTFNRVVRPDMTVDGATAQEDVQAAARERYASNLSELDARLSSSPWIVGEAYTLADAHAFVFYEWGTRAKFPMAEYELFNAWHERMLRREAVQRALASEMHRLA